MLIIRRTHEFSFTSAPAQNPRCCENLILKLSKNFLSSSPSFHGFFFTFHYFFHQSWIQKNLMFRIKIFSWYFLSFFHFLQFFQKNSTPRKNFTDPAAAISNENLKPQEIKCFWVFQQSSLSSFFILQRFFSSRYNRKFNPKNYSLVKKFLL
jgi:hypothetical protein